MVATVLEPCGLGCAERSRAASYPPHTIVTFRKGSRTERLSRGVGYRVEAVDHDAATVRLIHPEGKAVTWKPTRWGAAHAEAFVEVEQEFRTGDGIQFTRNNQHARRINTQIATVVALDPQRAVYGDADDCAVAGKDKPAPPKATSSPQIRDATFIGKAPSAGTFSSGIRSSASSP